MQTQVLKILGEGKNMKKIYLNLKIILNNKKEFDEEEIKKNL